MEAKSVLCPSCSASLRVPVGFEAKFVRCGQCQTRFELPPMEAVKDDDVAAWLNEDAGSAPGPKPASTPAGGPVESEPGEPGRTAVLPAIGEIKLARCDKNGAMLEFPAGQLHDANFRIGMPRRCIQCGSKSHLEGHLVIFGPRMLECLPAEAGYGLKKTLFDAEQVRHMTPRQILAAFPAVPGLTAPANLPMPFWVCDMCPTSRAISACLVTPLGPGTLRCQILFRSIYRAQEFLANVGAKDASAYDELTKAIGTSGESGWDALPLTVQGRLHNWYKPAPGERFVAYVPDGQFGRLEDGTAGIVVTDKRLLCHSKLHHREMKASDPFDVELKSSEDRVAVYLRTADWVATVKVDGDGLAAFRRAMVKGHCKANWK